MAEVHYIMYELKWKSDFWEKGGICYAGSEIPIAHPAKSIKISSRFRILVANLKSIAGRWNSASLGCDALKVFCCIEYEETNFLNS